MTDNPLPQTPTGRSETMGTNDLIGLFIVCLACVAIAAVIGGTHVYSWKVIVDGGYQQTTVRGSNWPIWVKSIDHPEQP